MTGVAAIAFAATFTSCSKAGDLYDEGAIEKEKALSITEKYEAAFEKAFGKVGSNVDWGFSSKKAGTRAKGDYDDYMGHLTPTYPSWMTPFTFPTDCDASKFLADVPDGVTKMPADGEVKGGTYFIDATTTKVNMNTGAGVIYVKGTVDLSSATCFEVTQNTEIYLVSGSTLKLSEADANKLKAIFYIEGTARLETAKRLKMDNTSRVYNHGTIKVGAFEVNNTSFLYNVGTFESDGLVYVANNGASIVNDGTIIAGDVEVAGSGHVQNNAEWTVKTIGTSTGTTTVNSNSATWLNNGHWTTDYYKYTAGSESVINNCFLEVKEDFDINLADGSGSFKIDAGGGVLAKNFNGGKHGSSLSGPFRVIMGANAVFKVTNTAALAASRSGTWAGGPKYGYGFFGPDEGGYAVFQAPHIVKADNETDLKVEYGGNLYVSAEDHFPSKYGTNPNIGCLNGYSLSNIFTTNADDEFSTGKPDITIAATLCNPGFEGNTPPTTVYPRVIAEDLSAAEAGDFDFNDVIFDVIGYNSSTGKTTLRLIACGGTLPLTVGGVDVHALYGDTEPGANGKLKMWNTGHYSHDPVDFEVDGDFSTPEKLINLKIMVKKEGVSEPMELTATRGKAACKILVDSDFPYIAERQSIASVTVNFTTYVSGEFQDDFWWKQTK